MAIAEAAKIVFQTALAGTLESKGFRRVSDTNYVIEGDGVEWRVLFGAGKNNYPGSFRDGTGIYLPEVDELYHLAFPKRGIVSRPLARTQYREHFIAEIGARYSLSHGLQVKLEDIEPCFNKNKHSHTEPDYWFTEQCDIGALGHRLNEYWCDVVWPWLEFRLVKGNICLDPSYHTAPKADISLSETIEYWVCGHYEIVRQRLSRAQTEAEYTDNEIREILLQRRKEKVSSLPMLFYEPSIEEVFSFRNIHRKLASDALAISHVLGVDNY